MTLKPKKGGLRVRVRAGDVKGAFISGEADNDPAGEAGRGSHNCDGIIQSPFELIHGAHLGAKVCGE